MLAWLRLRTRREIESEALNPTDFSLERYRPMERLLSDEEFVFLTRMPGYTAKLGAKWKRDRRRIFRLYLNELGCDFEALHRQVRQLVSQAGISSGSLVGLLLKQKIAFWRAMAAVDLRLTLDAAGIGAVDPRPLLQLVEGLRGELERATEDRLARSIA